MAHRPAARSLLPMFISWFKLKLKLKAKSRFGDFLSINCKKTSHHSPALLWPSSRVASF
jgi:hypothetical protein